MKCEICGKHFRGEGRPTIVVCGVVFCSECISNHPSGPFSMCPTGDVGCRPSREASRTLDATDGDAVASRATGRTMCEICGKHLEGNGPPAVAVCGVVFCSECITNPSLGPFSASPTRDMGCRPSREASRTLDATDAEDVTLRECKICEKKFLGDGRPTIVVCGVVFCPDCITNHSLGPFSASPTRDMGCRASREASRTLDATDAEDVTPRASGRRMECKICEKKLRGDGSPTIVVCGVVFCSECITNHLRGPSRTRDAGSRPSREASETRDATDGEDVPSRARERSPSGSEEELSSRMDSIRRDQSALVCDNITGCNDMLSQLEGYSESLEGFMLVHEDLITKLMDCVRRHEDVKSLLEQSKKNTADKHQLGKDHHHRLLVASEHLTEATSAPEVGSAIDNSAKEITSLEQWVAKCRDLFPDSKVVSRSLMMQKATRTALEQMAQSEDPFPRFADSLPMQVVFNEICRIPEQVKKMEELVNVSQSMKQLVESGQVVALQHQNDRYRYANIKLDGDNFCLHHLQGEPPASHAFTVQFDEALARATDAGLAFLDLSFGESSPRRVYVRMDPSKNPDLGRHFLHMCTGASGPSFAGTLLHVENQGSQPILVGGDYGGQRRTTDLPDLTAGNADEPWTEGLVGGVQISSDPTGFKFFITVRKAEKKIRYTFGKVAKGLDVAKEAAHPTCNDVIKVVDCGVVL